MQVEVHVRADGLLPDPGRGWRPDRGAVPEVRDQSMTYAFLRTFASELVALDRVGWVSDRPCSVSLALANKLGRSI